MQFHAKGHWSQSQNQQQLGLLGLLSHERPASDQIPDNNNQQLLGLIEGFFLQEYLKRPNSISDCLDLLNTVQGGAPQVPAAHIASSHGQPAASPLQF